MHISGSFFLLNVNPFQSTHASYSLFLSPLGLALRWWCPSSHPDCGRLAQAAQHQVSRGTWQLHRCALCCRAWPVSSKLYCFLDRCDSDLRTALVVCFAVWSTFEGSVFYHLEFCNLSCDANHRGILNPSLGYNICSRSGIPREGSLGW